LITSVELSPGSLDLLPKSCVLLGSLWVGRSHQLHQQRRFCLSFAKSVGRLLWRATDCSLRRRQRTHTLWQHSDFRLRSRMSLIQRHHFPRVWVHICAYSQLEPQKTLMDPKSWCMYCERPKPQCQCTTLISPSASTSWQFT
jgi:hypothetical protein